MPISFKTFEDAATRTRLKPAAIRAARIVLVTGKTQAQAAKQLSLPRQNVYRAVKRVVDQLAAAPICPVCGTPSAVSPDQDQDQP